MGTTYNVANDGVVTLTNDLIVDGTDLFVDVSTSRVGIGTAAPTSTLNVKSTTVTGTDTFLLAEDSAGTDLFRIQENGQIYFPSSNWTIFGANTGSASEVIHTIGSVLATKYFRSENTGKITNLLTSSSSYGTLQNNGAGTWSLGWSAGLSETITNSVLAWTDTSRVGIGTTAPAASALLELLSTTQGLLGPRMTTTQRDAISTPATGLEIYNTTTNAKNVYNGSAWVAVGGGSSGHTIQDEGSSLTARTNLNFVGAAVAVTDGGAGPNSTIVTINGNQPVIEEFTATEGQTTFVIAQTFSSGQERVYASGVRKSLGGSFDYTISGNSIVFNTGRSAGDRVVVEVVTAASTITARMAQWRDYVVTEAQFTDAATSQSIELFSLAAGEMIHLIAIAHTASFTGGGLTAFTVEVGIAGSTTKYASAFNVFQAPGGSVGELSHQPGLEDRLSATSIKITARSVGGNVSAATAGSVLVKAFVSQVF